MGEAMEAQTRHIEALESEASRLRDLVSNTESQLHDLKGQLQRIEMESEAARQVADAYRGGFPAEWIGETLRVLNQTGHDTTIPQLLHDSGGDNWNGPMQPPGSRWPLLDAEYTRYGRQMIMPEIGLHGQLRLKGAKVLIVGVGGLGCPAAAYLAGAGLGTIGLMDGDTVEVSNLHRQIAHATTRIGRSKVDSACEYLQSLNPLVRYQRYNFNISSELSTSIIEQYDLVLDCTDHPTSRYLVSDACVLSNRPLISASALKTEGQLMVLNNPPRHPGDSSGGPCYRCVFPKPPAAESVLSCGEGGILGPVVGAMGVLQALEAIKLLSKPKMENPDMLFENSAQTTEQATRPRLLMFSAYSSPQFREVRLRARRSDCGVCSSHAIVTRQTLTSGSLDYIAFCGITTPVNILQPQSRISASEFARLPRDNSNVLVDVRDETQYAICALRGSVNVPWTGNADSWIAKAQLNGIYADDAREKYIVCRFGNDSQVAAKAMMDSASMPIRVRDIRGGFKAWRKEVDNSWPDY